jgi:hypothetical protein
MLPVYMKKNILFAIFICIQLGSKSQVNIPLLESLMQQRPEQFAAILNHPDEYRLQLFYTQIDRDKNNVPHFKEFSYRLNPSEYFYPASTVKMPLAIMALDKINTLNIAGLTKNSTLYYDSVGARQETIYNNPYAVNGKQTIEQAIKEIFLVSDNNAANRLFEFIGQENIHNKLAEKGYKDAYIRNRLELGRTQEESRQTQAIDVYDDNGKNVYHLNAQYNKQPLPNYNAFIGKGYLNNNDSLINAPLDFSVKNRIYLNDLHHILQSVIFYDQTPKAQQFNLTTEDRKFLLKWMHTLPTESTYPTYDSADYWPAYCKFMFMGSEKGPIPSNIKIFNKVGDAYGFLLDISYIVDPVNKVEFMLSGVIYCNKDGIINDSKYDYETVGLPFYKNIGRLMYDYELKRKKEYLPNFDSILP